MRPRNSLTAAIVLLLSLSGCPQRESAADRAARFLALNALVGENRAEEAMPEVKRYVLHYPDDPAGHYLLGECYLRVKDANFTHAEGELNVALERFRATASRGAFEQSMDATEFEVLLYLGLLDVNRLWVGRAMESGAPVEAIRVRLEKGIADIESGLKLDQDNATFLSYRKDFEQMLHSLAEAEKPGLRARAS